MIFRRILLAMMTAAVFAAGTAVAVVALAFALYALVEPRLGRAGAAGTVAITTSGMMMILGVVMAWLGRRKPSKSASSLPAGLIGDLLGFFRDKPVVAVTAAVGAGILAIRDPKYVGGVLRAFLDGAPPGK